MNEGDKLMWHIAEIERLGLFLRTNAGLIAKELERTTRYRSVSVSMDMFKYDEAPKIQFRIELSFYDERAHKHYYLRGNDITSKKFEELCKQIHEDAKRKELNNGKA